MQIYRNDNYIRRRSKIGRYSSLAGMGVLLIGLLITWFVGPEGVALSILALIAGFILSQVGLYYANRFSRAERPDEFLSKALKGFDDRYILLQFETPASHVLITPNSCLVFTIKMQAGLIRYQNGKWKGAGRFRSLFLWLASDSLGNPVKEVGVEVDSLSRQLAKQLPEVEVPLQPVILFGNPNAEVEANESPVPAVHAKKLKDWLRGPGKAGDLDSTTRDQLVQLLIPASQKPS
jgi:hypothetical protein